MSDVLSQLSNRANARRDEPHYVYQLWGHRECIYVGLTSNLGKRLAQHVTKEWWPDVVRVTAERYPDKYSGLDVEKDLIQELAPIVNKLGAL